MTSLFVQKSFSAMGIYVHGVWPISTDKKKLTKKIYNTMFDFNGGGGKWSLRPPPPPVHQFDCEN